ncbi:MAG: polysaccharide deacetylase family protein [Candidatus Eiseniibacteriota bacterium]|nr:MAG: polysaccharide deacetylase family protein [Candidatus Eisenbacteria bacterium]
MSKKDRPLSLSQVSPGRFVAGLVLSAVFLLLSVPLVFGSGAASTCEQGGSASSDAARSGGAASVPEQHSLAEHSAADKTPVRGIVTIKADDGAYNNKLLADSLAERGLGMTICVNTQNARIGRPTYLNVQDLQELYSRGHEIADHTPSHAEDFANMNDAEIDLVLRAGRDTLAAWGVPPTLFQACGWPCTGLSWTHMRDNLAKFYSFAGMPNGWNEAFPKVGIDSTDQYRLGGYTPPDLVWNVADVKREIAMRFHKNEWVQFCLHTTPPSVVEKVLEVVDWLYSLDVPVLTTSRAARMWYEREWDTNMNVFPDEGFENDWDGDGLPDQVTYLRMGLYPYPSAMGSASWVKSGPEGPTPDGHANYLEIDSTAMTTIDVTGVAPGEEYELGYWVKQLDAGTLVVSITQMKQGYRYLKPAGTQYVDVPRSSGSAWEWQDVEGDPDCVFTVNDSTHIVRLQIYSGTNGSRACVTGLSLFPADYKGVEPPLPPPDGRGSEGLAKSIHLSAHPNPFNPSVRITYRLEIGDRVVVQILDVAGRLVRTIEHAPKPEGTHSAEWDGRDSSGRRVSPGLYLCRLTAGDEAVVEKLVLIH